MTIFIDMLLAAWHVLHESALYMILGLLVAGLLKALIQPDHVTRYLGANRLRSVVRAALIGIPIPL